MSSSSSSSHTIKEFLSTSKQELHDSQKNKTPITLVMGNDAVDIDTIAATVLFAYLRSSNPPQGAFAKHYVPLIQTGRSVLADVMHLPSLLKNLHHSGLSLKDLVVLDDMSLDGKQSHLSAENTHLFLINWNLLVGRQGENFSKNIAGVIDRHNKDENYVPQNTRPEPRIIGGAGSATALVVNAIREQNGERGWNKELAALGLAGILVPTEDLKRNATRQDESAYEFLAGIYGNDFDRSGFYHSIVGGEQRAPPVVAAPVVSRAPVMPSAGVNQATLSGIEPIQGYRTVSEASPEDIHSGGSHQTFTGNRLDPTTNETIKSFHEENLHRHGNELPGTSGMPGYGSSTTSGMQGYGSSTTSGTSGYGPSSTSSGGVTGALSNAAASVGLGSGSTTSNTQADYGSGSRTGYGSESQTGYDTGYGSGSGLTGSSSTQTGYGTSGAGYDGTSTSQSGYGNSGGVSGALSGAAASVGLGSGSSTSNTQTGYGTGSGLTDRSVTSGSNTGLGSERQAGVLGTPGYSRGVDSTDKDAFNYGGTGRTSGTAGTSSYGSSSTTTGTHGSSGLTGSGSHDTSEHQSEGFLSKVMSAVGLGHHEDNDSSTTHGTSGSTSGYGNTSSTGYQSSGLGDTASNSTRYEGEGVGQTERFAGGSSSTGYGQTGYGHSSTGTSGVAGTSSSTGYGSGLTGSSSTGYDNTSSSTGYGSSSYGANSEAFNSAGGSRGNTGSMAGDAARELKKDVTYGGERGGTGNGAAEGAQVNKDKVMY